jgi:hypothetical protein
LDRYCIDQDAEAKMHQIKQMANIYNNSFTTIVSLGAGENSGLDRVSKESLDSKIVTGITVQSTRHNLDMMGTTSSAALLTRVHCSDWIKRGWTYQECLLSRRCIIFTSDQAFVVCQSTCSAESSIYLSATSRIRKFGDSPQAPDSLLTIRLLLIDRINFYNYSFQSHVEHF